MKMKKVLIGMIAVFVSVSAMADDPTIGGVMVQQRWPWSRLVDIDYMLTCEPDQSLDVLVDAYDGSSLLTLPLGSFSGDLHCVQRGARHEPGITPRWRRLTPCEDPAIARDRRTVRGTIPTNICGSHGRDTSPRRQHSAI